MLLTLEQLTRMNDFRLTTNIVSCLWRGVFQYLLYNNGVCGSATSRLVAGLIPDEVFDISH